MMDFSEFQSNAAVLALWATVLGLFFLSIFRPSILLHLAIVVLCIGIAITAPAPVEVYMQIAAACVAGISILQIFGRGGRRVG